MIQSKDELHNVPYEYQQPKNKGFIQGGSIQTLGMAGGIVAMGSAS